MNSRNLDTEIAEKEGQLKGFSDCKHWIMCLAAWSERAAELEVSGTMQETIMGDIKNHIGSYNSKFADIETELSALKSKGGG